MQLSDQSHQDFAIAIFFCSSFSYYHNISAKQTCKVISALSAIHFIWPQFLRIPAANSITIDCNHHNRPSQDPGGTGSLSSNSGLLSLIDTTFVKVVSVHKNKTDYSGKLHNTRCRAIQRAYPAHYSALALFRTSLKIPIDSLSKEQ